MKKFAHDNGLSIFFGAIFLLALLGQSFAGNAEYNNQQIANGLPEVSWLSYLVSSGFAVDIAENWQSEYLQFLLYILATVWLVQRRSPESKQLDDAGLESDREQRVGSYARSDSPSWARSQGIRQTMFSWSLALTMGLIFVLSWLAQSIAGQVAFNEQQMQDFQSPLTWPQYVMSADFWSRTLQNWQSEFLAVGSMVVLSIYLRQRGSPESKPVGASHATTGIEG